MLESNASSVGIKINFIRETLPVKTHDVHIDLLQKAKIVNFSVSWQKEHGLLSVYHTVINGCTKVCSD